MIFVWDSITFVSQILLSHFNLKALGNSPELGGAFAKWTSVKADSCHICKTNICLAEVIHFSKFCFFSYINSPSLFHHNAHLSFLSALPFFTSSFIFLYSFVFFFNDCTHFSNIFLELSIFFFLFIFFFTYLLIYFFV